MAIVRKKADGARGHLKDVQREFAKQAAGFGDPGLTVAQAEYLQWMTERLPLRPDSRVLDVAAGTGHLSRAIAPRVNRVVAVDITSEMLRELARHSKAENTANLVQVRGLAERLPFRDRAFDLVVTRFAFHHFEEPLTALREMIRTCRPNGAIAIIELASPTDPALAEAYDRCERRRDPSHVRALSETELTMLLQDAGLVAVSSDARDIEVNVNLWLGLAQTPPATADELRRQLLAEINGGEETGMRPRLRDRNLIFLQRWVIVVATRRSGGASPAPTISTPASTIAPPEPKS